MGVEQRIMPTSLMRRTSPVLCDEHRGDLTEEQKVFARRCRDEMRSVYAELCVRLLQSEIMLEHGMVPDISTSRACLPQEGDAPWMLDRAG